MQKNLLQPALVTVLALLALAACGGDDDGSDACIVDGNYLFSFDLLAANPACTESFSYQVAFHDANEEDPDGTCGGLVRDEDGDILYTCKRGNPIDECDGVASFTTETGATCAYNVSIDLIRLR